MEECYIEHCSDTTTKLLKGAAEAIAIVIAYTMGTNTWAARADDLLEQSTQYISSQERSILRPNAERLQPQNKVHLCKA